MENVWQRSRVCLPVYVLRLFALAQSLMIPCWTAMAGSRGQVEGGRASRVRYRSILRRHMEDIESRGTRVGRHDGDGLDGHANGGVPPRLKGDGRGSGLPGRFMIRARELYGRNRESRSYVRVRGWLGAQFGSVMGRIRSKDYFCRRSYQRMRLYGDCWCTGVERSSGSVNANARKTGQRWTRWPVRPGPLQNPCSQCEQALHALEPFLTSLPFRVHGMMT